MALTDKLRDLASSIRAKTGTTDKLTIDQMASMVTDLETTPEMIVLVDENGTEVTAVRTDEAITITATPNDVRAGTTAIMSTGLGEGTKEIPVYHSTEGYKAVTNGSKFILPIPHYEYTKLQAIICSYNTNVSNSVAAQKVALGDSVYPVQSTEAEASILIDTKNEWIDFGITNTSGKPCLIRYFTFKEIY